MDVIRATEPGQDCQRQLTSLDDRYGKIGISAVAAAVRHQDSRRIAIGTRYPVRDTD